MRRVILLVVMLMLCYLTACGEAPEQYDVTEPNTVVYKETDAGELTLEILYPTKRVARRNPTVLVLHGGGWVSGSKDQVYRELAPLCDALRERGVTVVGVDYRLAVDGLTWRDCLADCEDALAYLIDHAAEFDVDTDGIGIIGYSAGAHLAMMTAIETGDAAKLCVSLSGPVMFPTDADSPYYSEVLDYYCGLAFADSPSERSDASPKTRLGRRCKSEFLLVGGTADDVVRPAHAEAMYAEAQGLGMKAELMLVEGLTHSYYSYEKAESLGTELAGKIVQVIQ